MVVLHQRVYLIEDQLVDTLQIMMKKFIDLELLKFNYPPAVPFIEFFFSKRWHTYLTKYFLSSRMVEIVSHTTLKITNKLIQNLKKIMIV